MPEPYEDPRAAADQCLAILKDLTRPQVERESAFEALLALPKDGGVNRSLPTFTLAVALRETRVKLGPGNADRIDWERIGGEALFHLFQSAHTIESDPASWLWGVIPGISSPMKRTSCGPRLPRARCPNRNRPRRLKTKDTVRALELRDGEMDPTGCERPSWNRARSFATWRGGDSSNAGIARRLSAAWSCRQPPCGSAWSG